MRRLLASSTRQASALASGTHKPRVLILGTGWGGNKLARSLDPDKFDIAVVSPSNHFLFTSFLPSTAVGTLEFRCIQEPIRTVPGLGEYYQAKARAVDFSQRRVTCEGIFHTESFEVPYDYLVLAPGCKTNTFGTPGVAEREGREVFFLKHLYHARQIRNRAIECFERAAFPNTTEDAKRRLLSFVVVGGGPTSCEFTTELSDFLIQDVAKWYPDLAPLVTVSLVEAGPSILGSFDKTLVQYYYKNLERRQIDVRTSVAVQSIDEYALDGAHATKACLSDGSHLPFGLLVWSAGLAPVKFIEGMPDDVQRVPGGRLAIDEYLRLPGKNGRVFALGDAACSTVAPQPPIATVAEQQAQYLADCFNEHYATFNPLSVDDLPPPGAVAAPVARPFPRWLVKVLFSKSSTFRFVSPGKMASMGLWGGVTDLKGAEAFGASKDGPLISGFTAMLIWRMGYVSKQLSWKNMVLVPMFWFKSMVFGRDVSRF